MINSILIDAIGEYLNFTRRDFMRLKFRPIEEQSNIMMNLLHANHIQSNCINETFDVYKDICIALYMDDKDLCYLYNTAKDVLKGNMRYLEIGAAIGGSMLCVDYATKGYNVYLDAIDPCCNDNQVEILAQSLIKVRYSLHKVSSDTMHPLIQDESIDLLLIDGCHDGEQPYNDIVNYFPKVKRDGIMLVHDCDDRHPAVYIAVTKYCERTPFYLVDGTSFAKMIRQ